MTNKTKKKFTNIKNSIKTRKNVVYNTNLLDYSRYNKLIGYYNNKKDCINDKKKFKQYPVTNYKFNTPKIRFDHLYYHAGDMNDFQRYGLLPLRIFDTIYSEVKSDNNTISNFYKNYNIDSILNTFKYLFYHLKKAIFVVIRNSKLVVFLPFSNANYINPFTEKLYFDKDDLHNLYKIKKTFKNKQINSKLNEIAKTRVAIFNKNFKTNLNTNRHQWILNNCNIRAISKGNTEGDHDLNIYKDLLEQLCDNYKIRDCEFFINTRDFPLLRTDLREPYNHLYNTKPNYIPKQYRNSSFAPILSQSKTEEFEDILMPNSDDWLMASNKYYLDWKKGCYNYQNNNSNIHWNHKINKVIFRGSATGCGITSRTNIRLKAAELAEKHPDILDIGIINWNRRPKKYKNKPIQVIDTTKFNFKLKNKINNTEKFKHKYILYLDGHVAAFRLGGELASKSLLFIPDSQYSLWFTKYLTPMKEFIPIKKDLSDLVEKTYWCIDNDTTCKQIANNAFTFYKKHFTKDKILEYFANSLNEISCLRDKKCFFGEKPNKDNLKNIAIVTIYRDNETGSRQIQKNHFLEIMPKLFKDKANITIIVVEQIKGDFFNIGKLKNIGFDLAKKSEIKFSHIIFTDIDIIPDTELIHYYLKKPDIPIALAIQGTRYHSRKLHQNKPFMGACCSFTIQQFEKINGYSNSFWGWGAEDDNLALKIHQAGIKIGYPKNGSVLDLEELNDKIISVKEKVQIIQKNKKENLAYEKMAVIKDNGLNNLNYKIISKKNYNNISSKIIHVIVDLLKKQDEINHTNWFPNKFTDNQVIQYKKNIKKLNGILNIFK